MPGNRDTNSPLSLLRQMLKILQLDLDRPSANNDLKQRTEQRQKKQRDTEAEHHLSQKDLFDKDQQHRQGTEQKTENPESLHRFDQKKALPQIMDLPQHDIGDRIALAMQLANHSDAIGKKLIPND
jgi:hypothetical protein